MPFQPPKEQPDFGRLLAVINTSLTNVKDKALWQVLVQLLKKISQFQSITVADIADLLEKIEAADLNILNVMEILNNATFLTAGDESADLPNSRELLAGAGITFDDSIPGERTVASTASGSELPVGSIHSTWVNINAGTMLGYGVWLLFATGVKGPADDITFTVY